MSEAIAGLPPPPPPGPVRDATAVILLREVEGKREVFWVQRGANLAFFAGFRAFPGGRLDPRDAEVPVEGASGEAAVLAACAVRELFEETGVLLAEGAARVERGVRERWRKLLLDDAIGLTEVLAEGGLKLHAGRLVPVGRWVTPSFLPLRYDARLFLVDLPAGEHAEVWPGELASGEWITPEAALELWARGETLLHPPNLHALRSLQAAVTHEELVSRLRNPPDVVDFISDRIEFQRGFRLFPLRTATLPPATHTNCYLLGERELLVVDPGAAEPEEQRRLMAHLQVLASEGRRAKAVVLTHHHGDHVGAAAVLKRELGLPVWCHAETARRIGGADRHLEAGETLRLEGESPLELEVLHTPGHAPGHLCLYNRPSRALVCGDMVANGSTIIVDPPEGNMGQYLASLARLKSLPAGTLYPAHGSPMAEGQAKLDEYLKHRQARIDALAAALESGPQTLSALVAEVYADVPPAIWPIAERSALASLEFLVEQGRVAREGEQFRRAN